MLTPRKTFYLIVSRLILWILVLGHFACSRAEDREAEFDEKQFNPEHASEFYRNILQKNPESSWANKTFLRLEALEDK